MIKKLFGKKENNKYDGIFPKKFYPKALKY